MIRVVVESPFAGDVEENLRYVRACMRDCLLHGEAPYASHALYTQVGVLRDDVPAEREHGIQAGFAWRSAADRSVFYIDRGWSRGMLSGKADCEAKGVPYEIRSLGGEWARTGAR